MQNEVVEFSSFEGSKENILPLKQGRNPLQLRKAFAPKSVIDQPNSKWSSFACVVLVFCVDVSCSRNRLDLAAGTQGARAENTRLRGH